MGAEFKFAGESFCGTNGAIAAYLEEMADLAEERFGNSDGLTSFLRYQIDGFFLGTTIILDEVLSDKVAREKFLFVLDEASNRLYDQFTGLGQSWISNTMKTLRERISGPPR